MRQNDSDEEAAAGKSAALVTSQVDEGNTSFASSSQFSSSSSGQEPESDQSEQTKLNEKRKQGSRYYLQKNKHNASHAKHSVHKMSEVEQLQNVTNQLQQSILQISTFHYSVPDVVHFKVQDKMFAIEQRHLLHDVNSVLFVLTQEHYARQRQEPYCLTETAKRKRSSSSPLSTSALHTSNRKTLLVPKSTRSTECEAMQYDECNLENVTSSSVVDDDNENKKDDIIISKHNDKHICNIILHKERVLRKRVRDQHYNENDSSEHDKKCFTTNCDRRSDNRSRDNIDHKTNSSTMSKWMTHIAHVEKSNATYNHCICKTKKEYQQQDLEVAYSSLSCTKKETKTKHDTVHNEEELECNKVEFIEIVDRDPNLFAMLINLLRGYKNAIPRQWRDACRAEAEYYGLQQSFNARYPASDHYFFYCPLERPMLTSEMVCHYASPPLERGLHIIHFAIVQSDRVGIGVRRTDVNLDALMDSHDFTGTALLWNDGKVTTHFGVLESYFSGWAYSAPIVIDVELDLDANLVKWMINGEFDAAVHRLPSHLPFAFFVIAARNSQVKIV